MLPYFILGITVILSIISFKFELIPILGLSLNNLHDGNYISLLTFSFIHGSIAHLIANAISFISFAPFICRTIGNKRFILLCLFTILLSIPIALTSFPPYIPVVGLSGIVFTIAAYWCIYNYKETIYAFFLPFNALNFLIIATIISASFIYFGIFPLIAHSIHLVGILIALCAALVWDRELLNQIKFTFNYKINFLNRHKTFLLTKHLVIWFSIIPCLVLITFSTVFLAYTPLSFIYEFIYASYFPLYIVLALIPWMFFVSLSQLNSLALIVFFSGVLSALFIPSLFELILSFSLILFISFCILQYRFTLNIINVIKIITLKTIQITNNIENEEDLNLIKRYVKLYFSLNKLNIIYETNEASIEEIINASLIIIKEFREKLLLEFVKNNN